MIDSNQRVARFEPISWQLIWQLPDKIEQVDILSTTEGSNGATDNVTADVTADVNGDVNGDVNADVNGQVTPEL